MTSNFVCQGESVIYLDYQNLTLLEDVNVDQKIILKYIIHECHVKIWKVFFSGLQWASKEVFLRTGPKFVLRKFEISC